MVNAIDHHTLAAQIATIIETQLRNEEDVHPQALLGSTLRLEGFLSTGQNEPTRIHLGTVDLSQLLAQASLPSPPQDSASNEQFPSIDDSIRAPRRSLREKHVRSQPDSGNSSENEAASRRKATGGLRPVSGRKRISQSHTQEEVDDSSRRMTDVRQFPQRKKARGLDTPPALQPTSLHKLVNGIWEQIYGGINFDLSEIVDATTSERLLTDRADGSGTMISDSGTQIGYSEMNVFCRKITQASRCSRALEVIVQARWTECFDQRVETLLRENPAMSLTKVKMTALKEACQDFCWSEKEMRNKTAIWRGYKELKDAGGWIVLVFAGMGIYRFCKYRNCFTDHSMQSLRQLQSRFEVAADTIHPRWRQLLVVVGESSERKYDGHPHDWVVSERLDPTPLRQTYLQWDQDFQFEHLDTSTVDGDAWDDVDPRSTSTSAIVTTFTCAVCNEVQSDQTEVNACQCFPNLYVDHHGPSPTQVFRTSDGRNNGLIACLPFERGSAVGEFVGLITKDLRNTDVMQGETDHGRYQIWQGRQGNQTKFVNHSCQPNSQFERFIWLGTQRIVLVSKGIEAGEEITVDYSDEYWKHLDKTCLCGSSTCRYKRALPTTT